MVRGSCNCGAVAFTVEGPLRAVTLCHCGQCRKWSGHYWAATSAPVSAITFSRDDGLTWYRSSDHARRGHCATCGSSLFWSPDGEDRYAIAAGSLEAPTGLSVAMNIYCDDKGDYYDLTPGIPAHGVR